MPILAAMAGIYTIKIVAQRTGLTPHVIRAWERRYGAAAPGRSESNRRLYAEGDVARLARLAQAVRAGLPIGQAVALTPDALEELLAETHRQSSPKAAACLDAVMEAVAQWDPVALEKSLANGAAALGRTVLLDEVVVPLTEHLGDGWREGVVRPAQEHLATAALRTFLGRMLTEGTTLPGAHAPRLLVTTPAGQPHELGALLAAVTAASEGWRVLYLGPSLAAEEIAGAAHEAGVRAVALSIVYPPDDPQLPRELSALRSSLDPGIALLVGGRAARSSGELLTAIHAISVRSLLDFRLALEALRTPDDRI